MYAIAVIRYRKPLEEVLKVVEEHRAYLGLLKTMGVLIASGPCEPRYGGILLLRLPDENTDEALLAVRDQDPFVKTNVAQYELLPWTPVIGKEELDKL
jgi:uncharacterized protein YciI